MKVKVLIEMLSRHHPNSEVLGVAHLLISSQLVPLVKGEEEREEEREAKPKRIFQFLKGQNRLDAATASGTPEETAKRFKTTPEYILFLRRKLANGKFKESKAKAQPKAQPEQQKLI